MMNLTKNQSKELKEVSSLIFDIGYRHGYDRIFDDFLTISICAYGHGTNEPRYLETIKRYNRAEVEKFVQCFAHLVCVYSDLEEGQWIDPLGTIYEEITSKGKSSALGQFFTPPPICNLMAQINKTDEWGLKINEPACGSGRMILAYNAINKGNEYICQDIDAICCKMTALNMALHKMRGVVYHMDVLANSTPWTYYVINHEFWKHGIINIQQP